MQKPGVPPVKPRPPQLTPRMAAALLAPLAVPGWPAGVDLLGVASDIAWSGKQRRPRSTGQPWAPCAEIRHVWVLRRPAVRYAADPDADLGGKMISRERLPVSTPAVELPEPWRSAAVTVVLPTYNEATNLPVVVAAIIALPLPGLRILVADDNSPDGTGDIADQLADRYGTARMTVAHRPAKQGLGRAYVDGMTRALEAGADFVAQMDSDLSHSPEYLPQMLGTLLAADADVVIGSRYVAGASLAEEWSWHRKMLSGFANMYVRTLLRLGIRDVTAGFKLWRSSALNTIEITTIQSNGYSFQVEMNHRAVKCGLKIVELPIHFTERREGQSKMSLRVQLESALLPLLLRRRAKSISEQELLSPLVLVVRQMTPGSSGSRTMSTTSDVILTDGEMPTRQMILRAK